MSAVPEEFTTVMLRNIPNKYTQQMLIEQLHKAGFAGHIDYLYLPIDFANRCNCGYCFLNLRTDAARMRFAAAFDGVAVQSCLPGFNSYKVCQVTKAKWQGREENVRRLRSGPELMLQLAAHPEWLPMLLDEHGNQEPFPLDDLSQGQSAPRRSGRKGGSKNAAGLQVLPPGAVVYDGPGGKGAGKGGGRKGRGGGGGGRGSQHGGMFAGTSGYAGMGGGFAGMPGMPVMTEQGLQYLPYGYGGFAAGFMPPYVGASGWYGPQGGASESGGGADAYHLGGYAGGADSAAWQPQQHHQQDPHLPGGSPRRVQLFAPSYAVDGMQEL